MEDSALRKIKRCMELSKSSNENEAVLALKQMQALMKKHNITSQHVSAVDVNEHRISTSTIKKPPTWVINLHTTIGQAMDCESILSSCSWEKSQLVYLGLDSSPQIAGYAFDVMLRKLKQARRNFIKEMLFNYHSSKKSKAADAFCEGWVSNVYQKVRNLNPNTEISEKIKAYKDTQMGNMSEKPYEPKSVVRRGDAIAAKAKALGFYESKDVDLFVATGHSSQALIEG